MALLGIVGCSAAAVRGTLYLQIYVVLLLQCCTAALHTGAGDNNPTARRQLIEHNKQTRTHLGRRVLAIKPQDTATRWALLTGLFTLQGMVAGCV